MVPQLIIKNFKSIKEVDIPCKKLNVFIGDPNGGKSNIIEALSLLSQNIISNRDNSRQEISKEIFRYTSITDLFFDFNIYNPVEILTNEINGKLEYTITSKGMPENRFRLSIITNNKEQLSEVIDFNSDVFFNLDRIVD